MSSLGSEVVFARRKGTRNLRIAIKSGAIRVSVPYGVPQVIAEKFVESKKDWIRQHHTPLELLHHGDRIGKSYSISFIKNATSDKISTRISTNTINVKIPNDRDDTDREVQKSARKAAEKALLKQAQVLLPQRLEYIAHKHAISYTSCTVKKLKSRWGSCDTKNNIVLNSYLIQLDWHLIDYVIYHELTHTLFPHHQATFWAHLETLLPDYKAKRKELKSMPTDIVRTKF